MKLSAAIFAIAFLPVRAFCEEHNFANGESITVQSDQAYVLVRTIKQPGGMLRGNFRFSPILIRVLSDEELKSASALSQKDPEHWKDEIGSNVAEPLADQPYAEEGEEEFLLTSLKPGTYVLGGLAVTNWTTQGTGILTTSLCMGTVKFEAKPGVITDLGTIVTARDNEPTSIPELSGMVVGKGIDTDTIVEIAAVRPATATTEKPKSIESAPLVSADYQAVGAFPNYLSGPLSRLAPLPGVLDYDKDGQVIDLKAAKGTSP